ncbi:MAG: hypothetical protein MH186_07505 [Marinobacter sp.]|nr:hypothetical protein [Marinobacter sp.]
MTITQWFLFFLLIQLIHFLGTWKLYVKAGRKAWEAAIPVYNAVIFNENHQQALVVDHSVVYPNSETLLCSRLFG